MRTKAIAVSTAVLVGLGGGITYAATANPSTSEEYTVIRAVNTVRYAVNDSRLVPLPTDLVPPTSAATAWAAAVANVKTLDRRGGTVTVTFGDYYNELAGAKLNEAGDIVEPGPFAAGSPVWVIDVPNVVESNQGGMSGAGGTWLSHEHVYYFVDAGNGKLMMIHHDGANAVVTQMKP